MIHTSRTYLSCPRWWLVEKKKKKSQRQRQHEATL